MLHDKIDMVHGRLFIAVVRRVIRRLTVRHVELMAMAIDVDPSELLRLHPGLRVAVDLDGIELEGSGELPEVVDVEVNLAA